MKLSQPISADLDIASKHLIIKGNDETGKSVSVEIPYVDEHTFMMWLIAVFQEKHRTPGGGGRMLVADKFGLGMHEGDGEHALSFTFGTGSLQVSFALPILTSSPERLAAIQGHLDQALKEMGQPMGVQKQ